MLSATMSDRDDNLPPNFLIPPGTQVVLRYAPTGELRDEIAIDAAQATCPAFVGPGRDILAITSGHEGLDEWADHSGAIFVARPGATGLPEPRWPGSTTTPHWRTR